mmetsp:Transcript_3152/g.8530  ORF Transcript_3152/g.8530 Transcript_3152/m.8530 type:complete len:391 (+) Transcript_3152:183-1355(+)|eukprot:CAMPEP_0197180936 /NCGR_PEP_ID=MMETSP1423-20130617/5371_1 /TAXON_ID=476441 /ORGANISM="Pseudo-nitzschia heimii, Strain UNC1101" /LENGTH=390 /DNA_ID=CAMNT_0042631085 /DNA_START=175 /DNA_END=1347 /DNA_ORIENTATION=-
MASVNKFVLHCCVAFAILGSRISAFQATPPPQSLFLFAGKKVCHNRLETTVFATKDDKISDAQKLLDQAAKLRAEIAAAEGKTLEQVEEEAKTKKRDDRLREEMAKEEASAAAQKRLENNPPRDDGGRFVQIPVTFDDMVRQASRAVERAFKDGKTRQTVRFNLVGEEDAAKEEKQWPGGAKQMYRESGGPLTEALLREVRAPTKNEHPEKRNENPQLKKQNIWDFDGTALHTAEAAEGASADVQALVFPNTDNKYLEDIDKISEAMGERLFLLVNPFWRNVESWGFNILAPGAKKRAQEVIFGENAFEETYSMMVFMVRGEDCVAVKAYPYDWQLFAFREDDYYPSQEYAIRLGSCTEEPTSSLITGLLNERPEFKETKTMRQMKKIGN